MIEAYNQTTQAPYCAAYLTILATKYGSFIPALSEHHAGGTNVGRTLINGERLGGEDVREHYFLGGEFVRDLRSLAPRTFRDLYGTYGPRSALYAEMVFGNITNVERLMDDDAAARHLRDAHAESADDRRNLARHQLAGRRDPTLQPGAHADGAREKQPLPAALRQRASDPTCRSGIGR